MSYDGDEFRGLDDDAVADYASQNTFVDHALRNNEYWLHKNSGVRCGFDYWTSSNLATAGSSNDDMIFASYRKCMLWRCPYLVKPGVSSITAYMWGGVSNPDGISPFDVYVSLQMFGVGMQGSGRSPVAVWTGDATATPDLYSITYDLPSVAREEFETDLVMWLSCSPVPNDIREVGGIYAEGFRWSDRTTSTDIFTRPNERTGRSHILRLAKTDPAESADIVDVMKTYAGSSGTLGTYSTAFTLQGDRQYANIKIHQDYLNYVAPRSFFIRETRDEL